MEAVIFTGLQASGKSTFYTQRFFKSHIRLNLDMLKTRRREALLFNACLEVGQSFVIDNTNPKVEDRARYIDFAAQKRFLVIGYYFQTALADAIKRNAQRSGRERIPDQAITATHHILVKPTYDEGFDKLFTVTVTPNKSYEVVLIQP